MQLLSTTSHILGPMSICRKRAKWDIPSTPPLTASRHSAVTLENDFVRRITRKFPVYDPVEIGIGDDGAVLRASVSATSASNLAKDSKIVVVTDMLLDGVHFNLGEIAASLAGRKAIAVNLSDLAAMGCVPTAAFVSIAVPRRTATPAKQFLEELYSGLEQIIAQYKFTLAGGDTNSWNGPFAINVCLTGVPIGNHPILRSGAKPGDRLFVTGSLGGSLASGRHLTFEPRIDFAHWLIKATTVNAMMDISDGLSIDLHRMMEASQTGAILLADSIPIHDDVPMQLPESQRIHAALSDGEDFELLISVPAPEAEALLQKARDSKRPLYEIGRITEGTGIQIQTQSGRLEFLQETGWQHDMG